MKNENTPNINRVIKAADSAVGVGIGGLGCFAIIFFAMFPIVGIIYLVGKFFGLPG